MLVPVKMLASQDGEIREVNVPDKEIKLTSTGNNLLELVYYYGQNDFQPIHNLFSVGVGDVAIIDNTPFICCFIGWKEISNEVLKKYEAMSREERINFSYIL